MHIDLDQLELGADCSSRFCIIGGGIAGLVLARKLAGFGFEVSLLEAGGLEFEDRSQSFYAAEMAERRHAGTTEGRFRTLGGSSTRWGGQLLPYADDIYSPVAGAPSTPWPIAPSEVEPYYDEITGEILHAGKLPFTDAVLPALGIAPIQLGGKLRLRYSKWAPFSRRNLAQTIGKECLESRNITVYTHANVAALYGDGGRITKARVLDYSRREFTFTADYFVVCCGTVESSRVLLLSPGVPNPHDQLGRYFHDHVSFPAAVIPLAARPAVTKRFGPFFVDGVLLTPKIEATSELQRDAGLVAVMAHFTIQEPEDSGIGAVRNLLTSIQAGRLGEALTRNLLPMFRGIGDVLTLLWATKVLKRRAISNRAIVRMNIDLEQPGTPENRIRLSETCDALGLRKAIVDWRISEAEASSAVRFAPIIKERLESLGCTGFEWTPGLLEGRCPEMTDTYHPMGGLRMGTDPTGSVVDTNLKVHGLGNLYVASCAVYPSGGSSNPSFTMIALTLRLADHLRQLAG